MTNPNDEDFDLENDTDLLSELEPDWQSIPVAAVVYANDGKVIGKVSEKSDDGLYVRSDSGDEYFVTAADIASVGPNGAKLLIASTEVIRARAENDTDSPDSDDMTQLR